MRLEALDEGGPCRTTESCRGRIVPTGHSSDERVISEWCRLSRWGQMKASAEEAATHDPKETKSSTVSAEACTSRVLVKAGVLRTPGFHRHRPITSSADGCRHASPPADRRNQCRLRKQQAAVAPADFV